MDETISFFLRIVRRFDRWIDRRIAARDRGLLRPK
jgi:hypothetical protein